MKNNNPTDSVEMVDPERPDCPSDETNKAVAYGKLPASKTFSAHLNSCSACQREFRDHRVQLEYEKMYRQAAWILSVVLLILIGVAIYRAHHPSTN